MRHLSIRITLVMLLCLATVLGAVTPVGAQGGGQGPSGYGGGYGGPGMAGATGNGSGGFAMPEVPGAGIGGNLPGGGQGPGGAGAGALDALGGALEGLLAEIGQRPEAPAGNLAAGGFSALFAASGLGAQVSNMLAEGLTWADFGGFGAGAETFVPPTPESLAALDELWNSYDPATAEQLAADLEAAILAQAEAISSASEEAQQAAQELYDAFWTEYYAAVTAAAALYADVTVEELEQLYNEAIAAAYAAIDYYETYADWYATYCVYYPWDCYAYAYDAANAAYDYVADVASDYPAAEVLLGEVEDVLWPVVDTLIASEEAYEALAVFANDQLGAALTP
ncbi:MAG: hypothetical protein JW910_05285, partial [Anaerolineae bacterium]|nr:hypothetical protein [Anaerolineae bacterium]